MSEIRNSERPTFAIRLQYDGPPRHPKQGANMPKMIFINLPVTDLAAATRFYEAIGCTRMLSSAATGLHAWSGPIPSPFNS
ncbi:hypothetical protein BRAS3843_560010 [Bradyrhizobium sp. STM 3843]|nr:hypothetical protein BRAS3843_560010 [Bradyrhizobium sp. STM 3843]